MENSNHENLDITKRVPIKYKRKKTGGRKVGVLNQKNRELIAEALEKRLTPLEVMLNNMEFAHKGVIELYEKILKYIHENNPQQDAHTVQETFKLYLNLRDRAQQYAKDAAPYIHPRLAQIEVTGKENGPPIKIENSYPTTAEAAAAYRASLKAATATS